MAGEPGPTWQSEWRLLVLTEDKDFGQLVFANEEPSGGVIFIRYPADTRKTLPRAVVRLVTEVQTHLTGSFVVLSPGTVRALREFAGFSEGGFEGLSAKRLVSARTIVEIAFSCLAQPMPACLSLVILLASVSYSFCVKTETQMAGL